jgi:Putative abortive phage resistance protein AbiGi, antitoxin
MAENVSSSVLFHFTKSMDCLKGILKNGFFPRYCLEYSLEPGDRKTASKRRPPMYAVPMVCFCDLPMSLIHKHLKEYGPYGIGLDKAWGLKSGVAPVIYTHRKAQTRQPIIHLTTKAVRTGDEKAANDLKVLAAYTKPFVGPAWRERARPRFQTRVRFYDEREWRFVPRVRGSDLFLSWKDYKDTSKRRSLHKNFEKLALAIQPDFIMYLILPYERSENNVMELHDYLMTLYTRKDAILVTSTIMTEDCIQEDV